MPCNRRPCEQFRRAKTRDETEFELLPFCGAVFGHASAWGQSENLSFNSFSGNSLKHFTQIEYLRIPKVGSSVFYADVIQQMDRFMTPSHGRVLKERFFDYRAPQDVCCITTPILARETLRSPVASLTHMGTVSGIEPSHPHHNVWPLHHHSGERSCYP